MVRGNVQPGESVYVHAGASGISTAVISVALELGATPYVGVFNKEQKVFLKSRYPQVCVLITYKIALKPNGESVCILSAVK